MQHISDLHSKFALRAVRLGEEKRRRKKKKPPAKNIMSASALRAAIVT